MVEIEENILKHKYFYQNKTHGDILVITEYPITSCSYLKLKKRLDEVDFNHENLEFARDIARGIKWKAKNHDIKDDWVPTTTVEYGHGVHIAILSGCKVSFSGNTSWYEPVINDWNDLEKLKFNNNNFWLEKIIEANQELQRMNEGDFLIMPHLYRSPLDYANGFRGNKIWMDIYDYSDKVKILLEFCVKSVLCMEKIIKEKVKLNSISRGMWECWVPEDTIFVNGDPADLVSREIYSRIGLPYDSKLFKETGCGFFHHHIIGLHQVLNIADIESIYIQNIVIDPNTKPLSDILKEDKNMRDNFILASLKIPIHLRYITPEEVIKILDILKEGRFILEVICKDKYEAEDITGKVREVSNIK